MNIVSFIYEHWFKTLFFIVFGANAIRAVFSGFRK